MVVREQTFEELALANPDRKLELHDGRLVEKPPMADAHEEYIHELFILLYNQLDPQSYLVRLNSMRVSRSERNYFIPDVCVTPATSTAAERKRSKRLSLFRGPVPLVIEVWSPSTGEYDVETKFAEYRRRGDLEIWRLHPYERTLTVWVRQADGSYAESVHRSGVVRPVALPGVEIDLDALFSTSE
jgi:Uma2 family endonuclease